MQKINYKSFFIYIIGLALGKILNHSLENTDMILVVMGAASIFLACYYYWKKQHQECIILLIVFTIACLIPVSVEQYSEDIRYLSLMGSIVFMIIGINIFVIYRSKSESDKAKKTFMLTAVGVNTLILLCFCAIGLYAFLQ